MSIRDRFPNANRDVTCIGCGTAVARSDAREYDKHGDRWSRDEKQFEYLCKPCHREYCHQPRDGLESTLVDAGAGEVELQTFLGRYFDIVIENRTGR
jgi:hypothetical protein